MAKELTLKQAKFLNAYLGVAKGNATEAARQAGYSDPEVSGFENKQNPVISARIEERLLAESLSSAEVLAELTDIARADWRNFLQIRTDPRTGDVVEAKIVLGDKVKALELLGKHYKLFTDKTEVTGTDGGPIDVNSTGTPPDPADVVAILGALSRSGALRSLPDAQEVQPTDADGATDSIPADESA